MRIKRYGISATILGGYCTAQRKEKAGLTNKPFPLTFLMFPIVFVVCLVIFIYCLIVYSNNTDEELHGSLIGVIIMAVFMFISGLQTVLGIYVLTKE